MYGPRGKPNKEKIGLLWANKRSHGAIDIVVPYYYMLRCGLDTFDLG
jgi:hypothetical protein